MGFIYADIELARVDDIALFYAGYITEEKIRIVKVKALVDSGAYLLCINENIKNQLALRKVDEMTAELADGTLKLVEVVGPVEIRFKNRKTVADAVVLSGTNEVLLGSIPLECMDVVINLKEQTMDVNPETPYIAKTKIK